MPPLTQDKTNWKYILIALVLAVIAGGGILWLIAKQEYPLTQLPEIKKIEKQCVFSKDLDLRKTTKYGIFGDDVFDTAVCGYAVTVTEKLPLCCGYESEMTPFCIECEEGETEVERTSVHFVIIDYLDEGFKNSLEEGIKMGNTVNYEDEEGNYRFSLGCLKEGKITAGMQGSDYIDETTQEAILEAASENPTSIILSFEEHFGTECFCCGLAEKVRLY